MFETIEGSHLVRTRCGCGAEALATPERAAAALCGPCTLAAVDAVRARLELDALPPSAPLPPSIGLGRGVPPQPAESPYPAPEISAHVVGQECPRKAAVDDLAGRAEALGWTVVVRSHARGSFPHATTGRALAAKDTLGLWMTAPGRYAVAIYAGTAAWSWETMRTWRAGEFPTRHALMGSFLEALR